MTSAIILKNLLLPVLPELPVLPAALEGGTRRRHSKPASKVFFEGFNQPKCRRQMRSFFLTYLLI
jgi:hypothetical protein